MKRIKHITLADATLLAMAGAALQFAPAGTAHATPAINTEPPWSSPEYRETFMRSCGDCHSNDTKWPWYTQLPIISGFIRNHVDEGRKKLNVSEWGTALQGRDAKKVAEQVQRGEMPPAYYVLLHPEARLDAAAIQAFVKGANDTFGPQESGGGGEGRESEERDK